MASTQQIPAALPGVTNKNVSNHCQMSLNVFGGGAGEGPHLLRIGQSLSTKNYWAQNVNSAKIEKFCSILVFFKLQSVVHWGIVTVIQWVTNSILKKEKQQKISDCMEGSKGKSFNKTFSFIQVHKYLDYDTKCISYYESWS